MKLPATILIVDDNATNLKLLRAMLEAEGLTVLQAADGLEALAVLEREPAAAIISDILMPRMDGYRFCLEVRSSPRWFALPFIFYTATYTSPGDEKFSLELGADKFLKKPAPARVLLGHLEEVMGTASAHPQPRTAASPQEVTLMKEYNERLVAKLEQKNVELLLHTTALESAANAVIITDAHGAILWANAAFTTLTGYTTPEVIGQNPRLLKSGRHDQAFYQNLWRTIRAGETWRGEFTNRRKDGSLYYGEQTITPVRPDGGAITHFIGIMNDVTARKQAEEALRASEERFRNLLENVDLIAMTLNKNGMITSCNDFLLRLTGWQREEIIGRDWFTRFIPQADGAALKKVFFDNVTAGTIPLHYQNPIKTRDGRLRQVQWNNTIMRNAAGDFTGTASIGEDVTERNRAEAELKISEERFRQVVENIHEVFWITDAGFNEVLYASPAYETIWGRTCASLYESPRSWVDAIHREDHAGVMQSIQSQLPHGKFDATFRILRSNDSVRWIYDRGFAIRNAAGEIYRMVGIAEDITERKLAEEERARLAMETRLLLESTSEGIYGMDLQGHCTFINRAGAELLGFKPEEVLGRNMHQLIHHCRKDGSAYPVEECPIYRALQSGASCRVHDDVFWRSDGASLSVEYSSSPILEAGSAKGAVVTFTDCTEKNRLQAQFLRNQRMESVGTLAGGMAHDLNNILAPILMAIQLLRMRFPDAESQDLINMVDASAQRGAGIVKQILAFARGSEGERTAVQLKHLIAEQEKICRDTFPPAIRVHKKLPADLWPVMGDGTQLYQVMMNLCVNARDAMPGGGALAIEADNQMLDEQYGRMHPEANSGPYVVVTVSDTGTGIPPHIMDKIFDPFFTTKEIGKGTGLGLSTALGIVRSHGGWVNVYSEVGKGTQFKVYLPALVAADALQEKAEQATLPGGHGELVLVVDDEPIIREITRETLEANGYRVLTASDGTEALAAYAQGGKEISLVITDMAMPFMDGPSTIRALNKMNPSLRIIAVSGMLDNAKTAEVSGNPNVVFLSKPFTAERLLTQMHDILTR